LDSHAGAAERGELRMQASVRDPVYALAASNGPRCAPARLGGTRVHVRAKEAQFLNQQVFLPSFLPSFRRCAS
jgi:hypothetical protein